MISYLDLTNYRGFERFRLSGLARVNLLVGRNNSGKTSILEAINLLDAAEDSSALGRIASSRGELISAQDEQGLGHEFTNVFHLFHGHEPRPSTTLSIGTDGRDVEFVLDNFDEKYLERAKSPDRWEDHVFASLPSFSYPSFILFIRANPRKLAEDPYLLVSGEGALVTGPPPRFRRAHRRRGASQLITAGSLGIDSMKAMWDRVNIEGRQSEVIAAMQVLEPSLKDLFFLTSDRSAGHNARGGILAAFEGRTQRVPLGSYGEGMRRLLALSLAMICTPGEILLIDEVDTGLHYSIMGDLWLMIVEAARRNDVQVFATTHSLDCVRGLAWLCEHHPELGEDVSLQTIEPTLEGSVASDARGIRIAVEQDIEVR